MTVPAAIAAHLARGRWRPAEALPWLAAAAIPLLFPGHLALATQTLVLALFALSLDLILGYCGIATLGHAAYFGLGAYVAGLLPARLGWHEPLGGLVAAAAAAGLYGLATGWLLLRYHGLALLMLTLASAILLQELANAVPGLTGGFDGLTGIELDPLLGRFEWDIWRRTHYWYALAVLAGGFGLLRHLVRTPFGRSLVGIRDNAQRMTALGVDIHRRRVAAYTLAAALAGVAGAAHAQTNAFVTVEVLGFARSGMVLIVLVLGGAGRLYGALLGAVVYAVLEDLLAKASPEFWQFGIGLALVAAVLAGRGGLLGIGERLWAGWRRRRS